MFIRCVLTEALALYLDSIYFKFWTIPSGWVVFADAITENAFKFLPRTKEGKASPSAAPAPSLVAPLHGLPSSQLRPGAYCPRVSLRSPQSSSVRRLPFPGTA